MNLRIFTLDEFVASNILTIPRIYGAKDYSVDKDISGLALRGKTLETSEIVVIFLSWHLHTWWLIFKVKQRKLKIILKSSI